MDEKEAQKNYALCPLSLTCCVVLEIGTSLSSAHHRNIWYVYKTNPVVGSMLAGVISHQPG